MIRRLIAPIEKSSFFVFGARGTGKSTFVKEQFISSSKKVWQIDMLDAEQEEKYSRSPSALEKEWALAADKPDWIFIDEVQKARQLAWMKSRQENLRESARSSTQKKFIICLAILHQC